MRNASSKWLMYDIFILKNLRFRSSTHNRKLGRESALWWTKTPFTCGRKENLRFLKNYPVGFEGASVFRWTESFLNIIFKFFRGTMFNQLVKIEVREKFHAV